MKIVHLCLREPHPDNWGYQENVLPNIHKRMGHEVTIITTPFGLTPSGEKEYIGEGDYYLSNGVRVIRKDLSDKYGKGKLKNLIQPCDIYPILKEIKPNLIMLHFLTIFDANKDVIRYLKENKYCYLVGDTHQFYGNSKKPTTLKGKIARWYCNKSFKKIYPYYDRIFALTPACIDFAIENFGLKREELHLLPLGFDPELCPIDKKTSIRREFRKENNIAEDDILLVHGGKIIKRRKTPETIEAVMKISDPKVKLVIFGAIDSEMEVIVNPLLEKYKDRILYMGALSHEEYSRVYLASDIAVFPGGQSVLWQEAIGAGLPLAVGYDNGLEYLDRGGNITFIKDGSVTGIHKILIDMLENDKYLEMKKIAESDAREFFSYERIAQEILYVANN